nr:translation initiation factor IF-2-like [Aegilops tauschii subsp. strangulata]
MASAPAAIVAAFSAGLAAAWAAAAQATPASPFLASRPLTSLAGASMAAAAQAVGTPPPPTSDDAGALLPPGLSDAALPAPYGAAPPAGAYGAPPTLSGSYGFPMMSPSPSLALPPARWDPVLLTGMHATPTPNNYTGGGDC